MCDCKLITSAHPSNIKGEGLRACITKIIFHFIATGITHLQERIELHTKMCNKLCNVLSQDIF